MNTDSTTTPLRAVDKTNPDPNTSQPSRSCGTCSACCTWFGVTALHKFSGKTCKFLDGRNPAARCTIYSARPEACSSYQCAWRIGVMSESSRPDRSGFVVSAYEERFVIQVFDAQRSGTLEHGPLYEALRILLTSTTVPETVVIFRETDTCVQFKDGELRRGKILKSSNYEDLKFALFNPPIGLYHTAFPSSTTTPTPGIETSGI